jgi:hypothetical protein
LQSLEGIWGSQCLFLTCRASLKRQHLHIGVRFYTRCVQVLLEHNKAEVLQQWHDIMPALLDALTSQSDGVVNQVHSSARLASIAISFHLFSQCKL